MDPAQHPDAKSVTKSPSPPSRVVRTYHCLCTNLLFATTLDLSTLPRRAGSCLDRSLILPCPPLQRSTSPSPSESESEGDQEDAAEQPAKPRPQQDYTLLYSLGLPSAQPAAVVRRDDGFEKRWLLRCGRCRLVVAYQLDWRQFGEGAGERKGRREDVIYVLPGGTRTTEEMVEGRMPADSEVGLGLDG